MSIRIVPAITLDIANRRLAAEFARLALEPYYSSLPPPLACGLIAAEFLVEGSELGDALVAIASGRKPVGLVAGYPLIELAQRQRLSLHNLLSNVPGETAGGFVASARELAGEVPRVLLVRRVAVARPPPTIRALRQTPIGCSFADRHASVDSPP